MVFEVKAHAGDKGAAIEFFMNEAPFAGRLPVFIGDDVTDEAGFAVVNKRGGVSIKVGDGETTAHYALDDPEAVMDWLETFAGTAEQAEQV
jgi:trehalose 6-phosphate phosphatase